MGKPNKIDNVNHPAHYAEAPFVYRKPECIDITKWLPFPTGNACKYIFRASLKGDDFNEDLDKALWYLKSETFYAGNYACLARHIADMLEPADKEDESLRLKIDILRDICVGRTPIDKIEQLRSVLKKSQGGKKRK